MSKTINLAIGDPSGPPPKQLMAALGAAIHAESGNHYSTPFEGRIETRKAVCDYYFSNQSVSLSPDQVSITHGARPAILFALLSAEREGEACGYLAPCFPAFPSLISDACMRPVPLNLPNTRLSGEWIAEQMSAIQGGVLLWNNPHNPTGRIFDRTEMQMILAMASAYDVKIVSDAVYIDLYEPDQAMPLSMLGNGPNVVEVISLSKPYRVCGWRVGAVAGDSAWVSEFNRFYEQMNGVAPPLQIMAESAWKDMPEVAAYRQEISARRALVLNCLNRIGMQAEEQLNNKAGSFVWAECPSHLSGAAFCEIAAAQGIMISEGSAFGKGYKNHVRFALNESVSVMDLAMKRLKMDPRIIGLLGTS